MINAARSASSKTINARRTARCTGSTIANRQSKIENEKWARQDSNLGPRDYESPALTAELQAHLPTKIDAAALPPPFVYFGHIASIIISADHSIAVKLGVTDCVARQNHSR